jgi:7-keto-8-aminopelargonate synthetase-like enzyme
MFPKVMKMIKVDREYPIFSLENATAPHYGICKNDFSRYYDFVSGSAVNFYTWDFLGLNYQVKNKATSQNGSLELQQHAKEQLGRIFKTEVKLFYDEKTVHQNLLSQLVSETDIVVVDQFVNTNMKLASDYIGNKGVKLFKIAHHDLGNLEEIIKSAGSNSKIWYLVHGTYSVPGDMLPVAEIKWLMDKYPSLFLYADDSESMGWMGVNGCGFINQNFGANNRVIVSASLNKGFGSDGGIVVFLANFATLDDLHPITFKQKNIAESIVYSSELMLNKIDILQSRLQDNIKLFHQRAQRNKLPLISHPSLPTVFMAAGTPINCGEICSFALNEGIFISSACYPQLPVNCSGIRINITLRHTSEDIRNLVDILSEVYNKGFIKAKLSTFIKTCPKN